MVPNLLKWKRSETDISSVEESLCCAYAFQGLEVVTDEAVWQTLKLPLVLPGCIR